MQFDSTAESNGSSESLGVGSRVQTAKNTHAFLAAHAFSRLRGSQTEEYPTPHNETAANALKALLTPKLASMLTAELLKELLCNLNANLESPEVGAVPDLQMPS